MAGSDPRFYYYPAPGGSLTTLDLAEQLAALDEIPGMMRADAYAGGVNYASVLQESFRVRVVLQLVPQTTTAGAATERALQTLANHLLRGGYVGFSRNHGKTWCSAQGTGAWDRSASSIACGGNGFSAWSASGALASGDEVVIESSAHGPYREYHTTSGSVSATASSVGLAETTEYTYPWVMGGTPAIVRYRHFWPALWLPEDQIGRPIVTTSRGITWTLDATLAYSAAATAALFGGIGSGIGTPGAIPLGDTTGVGTGALRATLDELLSRGVTRGGTPFLTGTPGPTSSASRFDPRVRR